MQCCSVTSVLCSAVVSQLYAINKLCLIFVTIKAGNKKGTWSKHCFAVILQVWVVLETDCQCFIAAHPGLQNSLTVPLRLEQLVKCRSFCNFACSGAEVSTVPDTAKQWACWHQGCGSTVCLMSLKCLCRWKSWKWKSGCHGNMLQFLQRFMKYWIKHEDIKCVR